MTILPKNKMRTEEDQPMLVEDEGNTVISPALVDAFKALKGQASLLRSTKATRLMVVFNTIRLPYPRQLEAMMTFYEGQQLAASTKGQRQNVICLFAESHTGKTTAAEHYEIVANADAAEGQRPVVMINLAGGRSVCDLPRKILKKLGEGFPGTRELDILMDRACEAMDAAGTQLLIIDETHEGGRSGLGPELLSALKYLVDDGHVGIVLLGTEKAEEMIRSNPEFRMRMLAPCRLGALDWSDEEDKELWLGLLSALDAEMVRIKIVSEETGLGDERLALALWQACSGVIGQLMKVVQHALRCAIHQDRDFIILEDLAIAVDEWSIGNHHHEGVNPLDVLLDQPA